jgi:hypothetical protein
MDCSGTEPVPPLKLLVVHDSNLKVTVVVRKKASPGLVFFSTGAQKISLNMQKLYLNGRRYKPVALSTVTQ